MISSKNFDCAQVMDLLDDYRRNSIDPHLRVLIAEHLSSCEACAAELQMRETMADAMQTTLPQSGAPKHLPSAVRRTIASQPSTQRAGGRSSQLLPWMLAAAVVITVGVAMLQVRSDKPLQRPAEIAAVARDLSIENKPLAAPAEMELHAEPAVAPASDTHAPAPPAPAGNYSAAPATMHSRRAQPRAPQGFAPSNRGVAPMQEQAKPTVQEGFAKRQRLFFGEQNAETPAPTSHPVMESTSPAVQDMASTGTLSMQSSTGTAVKQTTASTPEISPPSMNAPSTATITTSAPITTAPL